jgi:putative transposase
VLLNWILDGYLITGYRQLMVDNRYSVNAG